LGFKDEVLPKDDLWMCTTCYTCEEHCPRGVNVPEIIYTLRNMAVKSGFIAETHRKAATSLVKTGHITPLNEESMELRKKVGLTEKPPTTLSHEKALKEVQKIFKITGFDELIGI
jgi:heterodisulfide reductase subunit C